MYRFACAAAVALGVTLVAGFVGLTGAAAALPDRNVTVMDAGDPRTFNAPPPAGPGLGVICLRAGGVTFQDFVLSITMHGSVGAWHFAPSDTTGQFGQKFVATNRGGETHTFTSVAAF